MHIAFSYVCIYWVFKKRLMCTLIEKRVRCILYHPLQKKTKKQNITKIKDNTLVYFELGRFPLYIKRKFYENFNASCTFNTCTTKTYRS